MASKKKTTKKAASKKASGSKKARKKKAAVSPEGTEVASKKPAESVVNPRVTIALDLAADDMDRLREIFDTLTPTRGEVFLDQVAMMVFRRGLKAWDDPRGLDSDIEDDTAASLEDNSELLDPDFDSAFENHILLGAA